MSETEAALAAAELEPRGPDEILAWAIARFGRGLAISTGFQAEGCALIDMAWRIDPAVRIFTVDTGRQPAETHDLIDRIREHYGIQVEVFFPEAEKVERMVTRHGNNPFYRSVELRLLCCEIRKVEPLRRALKSCTAWVTGLRRDQWDTRSATPKLEFDREHGGIVKLAPLADWSEEQVWSYIRAKRVPYNLLYDKGYRSIGCAPCTRPVAEGEDARSGRWWWETGAAKECGIHWRPNPANGAPRATGAARSDERNETD